MLGFVIAQTPRLSQSISTMGSVAAELPFGPVYAMQLATSYMNLALPSNFARMAVNIRFFQRLGVPPAAAVTSGAIDSFANTILQAVLLVLLLIFSQSDVPVDFDVPTEGAKKLAFVLVGLLVVSILTFTCVGRLRRMISSRRSEVVAGGSRDARVAARLAQVRHGRSVGISPPKCCSPRRSA